MTIRDLVETEVTFTVRVEQDDIPVRGNAMASSDAAFDRECEDEILARLDRGDVWAWASVEVQARWVSPDGAAYLGTAHLGGCSYKDEAEFLSDEAAYFGAMKSEALDDLNATVQAVVHAGERIALHLAPTRETNARGEDAAVCYMCGGRNTSGLDSETNECFDCGALYAVAGRATKG